ncbi:hypothetical protein NC652_022244 [Populus alba x Populus x berolinensis]|nr:hypothetical protein NC652_022244 [Populus alba x Populus x berolinensis]
MLIHPSINHVFVEDCSDDVDFDDEEVDFDSSEEDYSWPLYPPGATQLAPVLSPSCVADPALFAPKALKDANVLQTATASTSSEPPPSTWCNFFASNRDTTRRPKLIHYSAFTKTRGYNLVDDDLNTKYDYWKMCLVGYIVGHSLGFKALQNLIGTTWHCEASLTIHVSGWLIFNFSIDADKLNVLSGGPYLVYGRPLILQAMPKYFDFSSLEMPIVLVWVKFPNLPLKCWSIKCLSKIASVLGKPIQSDMLTSSMFRLSYARVLVEVNLLSDLPYSIKVTLPNGSLLNQQVVYETLPRFCKHCKTLGHITSMCTKSLPPIVPGQRMVFYFLLVRTPSRQLCC